MAEPTKYEYALPLVVRFDTLIALIKENREQPIKFAARQSTPKKPSKSELRDVQRHVLARRTGAFNAILFKLQQWADKLSYENSTKLTAGLDVLETLDSSSREFINEIHAIFSAIAEKVHDCPASLREDTFDWDSWYKSVNESLLLELDSLVWPLRDEYARHLDKSGSTSPRPSIILCLDGGGVRSFSSLLILRTLMCKVQDVIRKKSRYKDRLFITKKFYQRQWLIQAALERPVRPRDFFDFIFGASSGGLIAVMLGRLQMTVDECISCFIEFGDGTFAHPRLLHNPTFLLLGRSKYRERTIHKAIQRVVNDFVPGEGKASRGQQHTFAAVDDKCKTGVWACASQTLGSQPCLFRTYNHEGSGDPRPYVRNPGLADSCLVWSVARATSAAPYLFDEAKIDGKRFLDGGLIINNPSPESYFEVDCLHQQQLRQHKDAQEEGDIRFKQQSSPSVAVLVSVGSGLRPLPKPRSKVGLFGMDRVTGLIDRLVWATWTSTERGHEQMKRATWQTETAYHRFNVEEGIGSLRQDEWKKSSNANLTLDLIKEMTKRYLEDPGVEQELQSCAEQLFKFRRKQL